MTEAVEHHELRSCSPHEYVRLLLKERKRELHSLERRYGRKVVLANDYLSCRRSLLQAIHELETLSQAVRLLSPQLVFVVSNLTNNP
jgi:hypothetical protein